MPLPIKTEFDVENNVLYTTVDELGTYCVFDMEKWVSFLSDYEEDTDEENELALNSRSLSNKTSANNYRKIFIDNNFPDGALFDSTDTDTDIFDESETQCRFFADSDATALLNDSELYNAYLNYFNNSRLGQLLESPQSRSSSPYTVYSAPLDVVFILQSEGESLSDFNAQKSMIIGVSDMLFGYYSNARVYVVEYKESSASILQDVETAYYTPTGFNYFTTTESLTYKLNGLVYRTTSNYCNRGGAFSLLINNITLRGNANKFVFQAMNGSNTVNSGYLSQLDLCATLTDVNYSEITPSGYYYLSSPYGIQVAAAIAQSNGLIITFGPTTTTIVYNHITSNIVLPPRSFSIISAAGYTPITLDAPPSPLSINDQDKDGLRDWQEIATESPLIEYDNNGITKLPTIQDCINFASQSNGYITYVQEGLDRYESDNGGNVYTARYQLPIALAQKVLPILSDPTNTDGDKDGYGDYEEMIIYKSNPLICDVITIGLKNPNFVDIVDGSTHYFGGNQSWWSANSIESNGGCGVVAASNILAYMSTSENKYNNLYPYSSFDKIDFTNYMTDMLNYVEIIKISVPVTLSAGLLSYGPSIQTFPLGVWPARRLVNGVKKYAEEHSVNLRGVVQENNIATNVTSRYIKSALKKDKPIAMLFGLNFTKFDDFHADGSYWDNDAFTFHWVTITEIKTDSIAQTNTVKVSTWGGYAYVDLEDYIYGEWLYDCLIYFE